MILTTLEYAVISCFHKWSLDTPNLFKIEIDYDENFE